MAISFDSVPANLRIPIVTAEFDNSRAAGGPSLLNYRALIIAQRTAAGTSAANSLTRVTSEAEAIVAAGRGSQGHRMARAWFKKNKFTELWLALVDDNAAGVLATKTLTFTGTATAAGTLNVYIGGDLVQVAVAVGDTHEDVAGALEDACDLLLDLPVTASVAAGVVTLTALNKGAVGQDLDVRVNYERGQATPAGLAVVIANGTEGVTNPVLTTMIANLGDTWYQVIAHPFTDDTSLDAIEAELTDRNGPMRMIDGVAITSALGTASALGTLGEGRNNRHSLIVAQPGTSPITPPSEFAAECAAAIAASAAADPARPFQTLALVNAKAPAESALFTAVERNLALYDGISTSSVAAGRVVQLERMVTTYQTNAAGASDESYLDATTMFTLMFLRYSWRNRMATRYPRHKLASDGTQIAAGQAVITPSIGKAEALTWFREMEELGLVEGFDQFKEDLVVERNVSNPNRLDFLLSPDLINQLIVTGTKVQFKL